MRKRFFRAATVSIVAGLLIAFIFAVPLMQQVYTDEMRERLDAVLVLAEEIETSDGELQGKVAHLGERLREEDSSIRLTVLDAQGTVLADSEVDRESMDNHAGRPEVEAALETGAGQDIRKSATTGSRQMYVARRIISAEGDVQVIRASVSLGGIREVEGTLWLCGGVGIFMGLVAALISAHYAAGRVVEPLQSLTDAARAMAEGDAPDVVEDAPDEMGELAGAFNRMAERLAAAHEELAEANDRLAGILQGMDDGVVAVDADGRLLLMTHRVRNCWGIARRQQAASRVRQQLYKRRGDAGSGATPRRIGAGYAVPRPGGTHCAGLCRQSERCGRRGARGHLGHHSPAQARTDAQRFCGECHP